MTAGSPRSRPVARPVAILFLKAPLLGAVKTRLAADIGTAPAWRFYCDTAQRVGARLARRPEWDLVVAAAPRRSARHLRRGLPRLTGLPCIGQGEGDLGARMARCLDRFAPRPRLLFGADIPGRIVGHRMEIFLICDNCADSVPYFR